MVANNLTTIRFFENVPQKISTRVDFFPVALLRWSAKSDFWGSESEKIGFLLLIIGFFSQKIGFLSDSSKQRAGPSDFWFGFLVSRVFGFGF